MMPIPARPASSPTNYRVPLPPRATAAEAERELARAWASLAARRDAAAGSYRVTVLRPFEL